MPTIQANREIQGLAHRINLLHGKIDDVDETAQAQGLLKAQQSLEDF